MTRTSLSGSKGQGHQVALLSAALTRKAAAAVSVGTYSAWEHTATLPSVRRRKALRHPRGRRGAGAYRGGRPPTACYSSFVGPGASNFLVGPAALIIRYYWVQDISWTYMYRANGECNPLLYAENQFPESSNWLLKLSLPIRVRMAVAV